MLGLTLATIGLYGVMSYSVTQQTGEIGLRTALGARSFDILKMIFGKEATLIIAGLFLGLIGAMMLTKLLSGALYGVNPNDPVTFVIGARR